MLNSEELDAVSEEATLIDKLLAEQKELTAVERFSQKHAEAKGPVQRPHYEDLIPIRKPGTGEQYSFSVDLDKCTGCKACVVACHSRNGLDENESWRDVGKIRSASTNEQQTVTTACHHCADPACLSGCPVGAYEKVPETGIVKHLDDQCIGCEYCSLKCPYDVPKYNKKLGIVRKCDMCHDRLEEGEAPACVQSCPNGAIAIELVATEEVYDRALKEESIIEGAYRSDYTFPTTRFFSDRVFAKDMAAVDEQALEASHKHTPLSWMLMLTQVSVGISLMEILLHAIAPEISFSISVPLLVAAVVLGKVGLIASVFHLGSPFGAWRVFLGLRTSWLSREVIMFGIWMPVLMGYTGSVTVARYAAQFDWLPSWVGDMARVGMPLLGGCAALLGLLSVFCSIMVYVDTKRAFWSFRKTTAKFVGTMLIGGVVSTVLVAEVFAESVPGWMMLAALAAVVLKLGVEIVGLLPARQEAWSTEKKSALIQLKTLKGTLLARWIMIGLSVIMLLFSMQHAVVALVALGCLLIGEWLERQLFFQAVETLKMPGNLKR